MLRDTLLTLKDMYVTGVRDGESRQGYQRYNRYPNDHNRDTKPSSASVETFTTNV